MSKNRLIISIIGRHHVGKTTAAKYLQSWGYKLFDSNIEEQIIPQIAGKHGRLIVIDEPQSRDNIKYIKSIGGIIVRIVTPNEKRNSTIADYHVINTLHTDNMFRQLDQISYENDPRKGDIFKAL